MSGIIVAAGVLLLEHFDHLLDDLARGVDLVRLLGRNIVEDIFGLILVEVIGQLAAQAEELADRIVEDDGVEELAAKVLRLSGVFVLVVAAVPQEAELLERDARHILEDLLGDNGVEGIKRDGLIAVGHEEGRDRPRKAAEMVTNGLLNIIAGVLADGRLRLFNNRFPCFFNDILYRILQFSRYLLLQNLLLLLVFFIDLKLSFAAGSTKIQCFLALLFQFVSVDIISCDDLINFFAGFPRKDAFYALRVRRLKIITVMRFCLFKQGLDCIRLNGILQLLGSFCNGIFCRVFLDFLNDLLNIDIIDDLLDLVSEGSVLSGNDDFARNLYFAIFIQIESGGVGLVGKRDGGLGGRFKLAENFVDLGRSAEDVVDILEEIVAHEAAAYNFVALDLARNGEDLFRVELDHFALVVFREDREEVQKLLDVLFARLGISAAFRRIRGEVVGEFLEDDQRAGRVKIKDVSVLLAEVLPVFLEKAGILRAESGLHIERGAADVAEHENGRPFRDRNAGGQLADGERDRLSLAGFDRGLDFIKALLRFFRVVELSVAGGEDDVVIPENRMDLQLFGERLGAVDAV